MNTEQTFRTEVEIVARIDSTSDYFGFAKEVLVPYLSFENAKKYLKPDTKAADWTPLPMDREKILEDMREYAAFAWEKIVGHRGISASRSVMKLAAWAWLLGESGLARYMESDSSYAPYGAPAVAKFCEHFGFPIPDGAGVQRMRKGLPCNPECEDCRS